MTTKKVFIIGSRGLPANYGGFETFVENLVKEQKNKRIKYFVASQRKNSFPKILSDTFEYYDATVFQIDVPNIGSASSIIYDIKALNWILKYAHKNGLQYGVVYILGNTIGPLLKLFLPKLHEFGIRVMVNPDGLEWKRAKWGKLIRSYLKLAEKCMVKNADLIISDNLGIDDYLKATYPQLNLQSRYIGYGVNNDYSSDNSHLEEWLAKNNLHSMSYYLVVGRFIPENNYETILKEFMKSKTLKQLVIVTQAYGKFYELLKNKTKFEDDARILFVGTIYDSELLRAIREDAFAYIHGHSVGGTNPSLLEALNSTQTNLVFDVNFNRFVAQDSADYWSLENMNLANLIDTVDLYSEQQLINHKIRARKIIDDNYTWNKVVSEYEDLFLQQLPE